jgi:hypothetical protein
MEIKEKNDVREAVRREISLSGFDGFARARWWNCPDDAYVTPFHYDLTQSLLLYMAFIENIFQPSSFFYSENILFFFQAFYFCSR